MVLRILTQRLITTNIKSINFNVNKTISANNISTSTSLMKSDDRRQMRISLPAKDEGTIGERTRDIDAILREKVNLFPDETTPTKLFFGVPFNEIHVCNIKVSRNNTIINVTDYKGVPLLCRSCGVEGFKNARKGTNIAAQATAISLAGKAIDKGIKTVRIKVQGIGPGRMSAIKGLQMSGMNVVSVTDDTRVSWNPPRPRKQKRL